MADYTFSQLEGLWIQAGGSRALAPLMAAIALAESSGNPQAENRTDNGGTQTSWGLWQISDGTHSEPVPGILNPETNAKAAVAKYRSQGLGAWGTYTSGAYRQYLSGAAPTKPPADPAGSKSTSGGGGDLGQWASAIWTGLGVGLEQSPEFSGAGQAVLDPAQAIAGLTAPFVKIATAVDWFMQPNHWIRIFCGIGGGLLTVVGIWNLSHVGGQASSVTVQGTSIPTSAGGTLALPFGVLELGLGGVGLFVAFHNLPSTVVTFPDFLSHLRDEIHKTPSKAPEPVAA